MTDPADHHRKILASVAAKQAHAPKVDNQGHPLPDQPSVIYHHDDRGLFASAEHETDPTA